MIRTQIQLAESQAHRLKEAARLEGVSLAEMIRRCVDRALPQFSSDQATRYANARKAIGAFTAKQHDISEQHDQYLDEAYQ